MDFIGSTEACQQLDIHLATLLRWINDGKITPAYKLPGRNGAYVFHRSDVDTLVKQRAEETA